LVEILQEPSKICIMATRRVEIGLTGETVRANIKRLRREKDMTLRDLSDHMGRVVRPMAHNTISEIERGARRVDVDDLMALAEGLNVSPIALLMPKADTKNQLVQATGHPPERAQVLLWSKLLALKIRGLGATTEPTLRDTADYRRVADSFPSWALELALELAGVLHGDD
jgi:transcriptional regulator with XRE-family HTH domain